MDFSRIADILGTLLLGAAVTIKVTVGALIIAVLLGLFLGLVKTFSRNPFFIWPINVFVEIARNVPALTHLFILYFGLAYAGIRIEALFAAILGLGLIGAASLTDVFRAGFLALGAGQREAGLAIGLTPLSVIRYILLPQAIRITLPPVGNFAIQLLKDTSVAAAIAAPEIMFYARNLVTSTFETTLTYLCAAALYLAFSLPLSRLVHRLERRGPGLRASRS